MIMYKAPCVLCSDTKTHSFFSRILPRVYDQGFLIFEEILNFFCMCDLRGRQKDGANESNLIH